MVEVLDKCAICGSYPERLCHCTSPPTLLCSTCSIPHYLHQATIYQLCQVCNTRTGYKECPACFIIMCPSCETQHQDTCALIGFTTDDVIAALFQAANDIKAAREQANVIFSEIIQEAYKQKIKVITELTTELNHLTTFIKEFKGRNFKHSFIEKVRTSSTSLQDLQEKLSMISVSLNLEEVRMLLKTTFTYGVNQAIYDGETDRTKKDCNPGFLPFFGQKLKYFTLPEAQQYNLDNSGSFSVRMCTVWTFINTTSLLLCGEAATHNAYKITNVSDISAAPPSLFVHFFGGLGTKDEIVYSFGGQWRETPQRYCEKYDSTSGLWTQLENMQFCRSYFHPALWKNDFFLIGGRWCASAESFNVVSQSFKTLALETAMGTCVAVPFDGDLIVFLENKVCIWEQGTGSERLNEIIEFRDRNISPHQPPIRQGDDAYFLYDAGILCLHQINLCTKRITMRAQMLETGPATQLRF